MASKGFHMTFRVDRDRGISHQVTHLSGNDTVGVVLHVCEQNDNDEEKLYDVTITPAEFKRNNIDMYNRMKQRQYNG